jgi:hypothetical protein
MGHVHHFRTTDIRGNAYVPVNERIKFFRTDAAYAGWAIITDFPVLTADGAVCKATILNDKGEVMGTGHAQETRAGSNINKTSFVENCETSAVGRALGLLGIGVDTSIASADEVDGAIKLQDDEDDPPPDTMPVGGTQVGDRIRAAIVEYGIRESVVGDILEWARIDSIDNITDELADAIIGKWRRQHENPSPVVQEPSKTTEQLEASLRDAQAQAVRRVVMEEAGVCELFIADAIAMAWIRDREIPADMAVDEVRERAKAHDWRRADGTSSFLDEAGQAELDAMLEGKP